MGGPGLPEFDGDACSLGRLACASCASCVAACPTGALGLEEDALTLTPDACTGCGACVAVCPQRAVSLPDLLPLGPVTPARDGGVVLQCPQLGNGVSPCLNGIGLSTLAQLWGDGVRRIALAVADCSTCPRGPLRSFTRDLEVLNALLSDRGLAPLVATFATGRDRARLPVLGAPKDRPEPGRRAFLRGFTKGLTPDGPAPPLARLQAHPGQGAAARHAFSPRIDAETCTGCMACLRICPEGSLRLIKAEDGDAMYGVDPSLCSGCGLCVDVCDVDAIEILTLAPAPPDLALDSYRCRGCRVEGHLPAGHLRADGLCPVCARTGHHRKLHQVIG